MYGFRALTRAPVVRISRRDPISGSIREFPKIWGTLFWGPYNKDPTI